MSDASSHIAGGTYFPHAPDPVAAARRMLEPSCGAPAWVQDVARAYLEFVGLLAPEQGEGETYADTVRRLFAERESIAERLAAMSQNHAAIVASNAVLREEVHQQRLRLEAAADIYDCAMQRVRELEAANK